MKQYVQVSLVVLAALSISSCTGSGGRYIEAVQEAESAMADLERVEAQKSALAQQLKTLKELNAKLMQEGQLAKDELQRLEYSRDTERGGLADRNKQMENQVRLLVSKHKALLKNHQDLKRRNSTLKSIVAKYQKELKEPRPTGSSSVPKAASSTFKSIVSPKPPTPPIVKGPSAVSVAQVPSGKATPTPVNLNKATPGDMVLFLGLTKDVADRVVMNRPYRIKGELVAKSIISKKVFDRIKDRVTVRR